MIINCPNCKFVFTEGDEVPVEDPELVRFNHDIQRIITVFICEGGGLAAFNDELGRMGWGSSSYMDRITNKHTWRKIFAHFEPIVRKMETSVRSNRLSLREGSDEKTK